MKIRRRAFLKSAGQSLIALGAMAQGRKLPSKDARAGAEAFVAPAIPAFPPLVINVREMGTKGDGRSKDTADMQRAIDRVSVLGGGEVLVPEGTYLTGALMLRSGVRLRLAEGAVVQGSDEMADYRVTQVRWEGRWVKGYAGFLSAWDAEGIAIVGPGKIRGSEAVKGRVEKGSGMRLPALLEFVNCRDVWVEGVKTEQFGMWSTHPVLSRDVTFRNLEIKSGADGIDVDSCQRVVIDGCAFETADDCISLKSGRGQEAFSQIATRPEITCENVTIANCTFSDSAWACIGIGSETSGGVRNARIERCTFIGAKTHAIYIKSRPGRGASVEEIHCEDLDISGVQGGFLRLNNMNSGKQDEFPVPGFGGVPLFRNFSFRNVRVKDVPQLVQAAEITAEKPLEGLVLENITGTCRKGMVIANARGVRLAGISVTGFAGALLETENVTGSGLDGAVGIPVGGRARAAEAVQEPRKVYVLH